MSEIKAQITFYRNGETILKKSYIDLRLFENSKGQLVFSVCGSYRGGSGQCLDDIAKFNHDPLFKKIYHLWKNYHLNDMHAGTEKQEQAIAEWEEKGNKYSYNDVCKYLKSINLYEDNGYKYGHSWLYREIPEKDLALIKNIIEIYKK